MESKQNSRCDRVPERSKIKLYAYKHKHIERKLQAHEKLHVLLYLKRNIEPPSRSMRFVVVIARWQ